jgi:hypothetical protein
MVLSAFGRKSKAA